MSEEEHSVHSLMEMEIISFEDEHEELEEYSDAEKDLSVNAPFEIDPGCFNFDFAFNSSASPAAAAAHAPSKMKNLCGLESWGASSALHAKAPAAVPVVSGDEEQFIPQIPKQPSLGAKPHSAWSFASSSKPAVHSLSHQASIQEQAHIQKQQQQQNQNFPPLKFTAFGSVTTFLCSR